MTPVLFLALVAIDEAEPQAEAPTDIEGLMGRLEETKRALVVMQRDQRFAEAVEPAREVERLGGLIAQFDPPQGTQSIERYKEWSGEFVTQAQVFRDAIEKTDPARDDDKRRTRQEWGKMLRQCARCHKEYKPTEGGR